MLQIGQRPVQHVRPCKRRKLGEIAPHRDGIEVRLGYKPSLVTAIKVLATKAERQYHGFVAEKRREQRIRVPFEYYPDSEFTVQDGHRRWRAMWPFRPTTGPPCWMRCT